MVQEYTQYTFNLPDGKQTIQTAVTLEEAKQEALGSFRRNGYDVPDLSNFTEKPADAGYYMATRKPVPSGVLMGGQDVGRNTQSLLNMGYTIEDGRVFAPIMAPPQQVEQKQEAAKPFVDFMDPQKTAAENMQSATTYVEPASTPAESVIQQTEDVFQQPVTTYTPAGTTPPPAVSNYTPAMAQGPRAVINPYMAAAPNIQPMAARPNVQMPPLPQFAAPQPSGTGIMGQLPQSSGPVLRAPSNAFSQDYAGFLTKRN